MSIVTVSAKYQVVVPKDVRRKLNIRSGQKLAVFAIGNGIELVRFGPMQALQGRFPELPPFEREHDWI